ncbi:MAG: hypothetical protein D6760_06330, partial [Deltaproteobacteria bacterium]
MAASPAARSKVAGLVLAALCLGAAAAGLVSLWARGRATFAGDNPLAALEAAEHVDPLNWLYPYKRAELLQRMGRREEAAALYRKALSLNRSCATCWIGLAEVARATGGD